MSDTQQRLEQLLATEPLAVLSTSHDGAPYASLVAIAALEPGRVHFATTRSTRKWGNVSEDPRVALLVDDRSNDPADFHRAAAATGIGAAAESEGANRDTAREALLERHPHLADFLASPSTVIASVDIERWYVVTRFQSVDCFTPRQAAR